MLSLVLGGVRSGKSRYAEKRALQWQGPRVYLATAVPFDEEMKKRIRRHQEDRGKDFFTLEDPFFKGPRDLFTGEEVVVFECLTVLVANLLYSEKATTHEAITASLLALKDRVGHLILVSNHLFLEDTSTYSEETMYYLKLLASCHKALAREAEEVIEIRGGIPLFHKGGQDR